MIDEDAGVVAVADADDGDAILRGEADRLFDRQGAGGKCEPVVGIDDRRGRFGRDKRRQRRAVDAGEGLAFPACALAVGQAIVRAREHGVAFAAVTNSHHFGVAADHLRPVAAVGFVGLALGNSPAAMPVAGGTRAVLGTNPVAAIFPRRRAGDSAGELGGEPLMIDLSLSEVARGKLMVAARDGRSIPLGWALDAAGEPTIDPAAGMTGSMLPIGAVTSAKGAMLALVVEVLVSALVGASFGFEASSFFVDEGNRPKIGQAFIVIDPAALAGRDAFLDRIEVLVTEMMRDEGVRLPGARRAALLCAAEANGIVVGSDVLASLAR